MQAPSPADFPQMDQLLALVCMAGHQQAQLCPADVQMSHPSPKACTLHAYLHLSLAATQPVQVTASQVTAPAELRLTTSCKQPLLALTGMQLVTAGTMQLFSLQPPKDVTQQLVCVQANQPVRPGRFRVVSLWPASMPVRQQAGGVTLALVYIRSLLQPWRELPKHSTPGHRSRCNPSLKCSRITAFSHLPL